MLENLNISSSIKSILLVDQRPNIEMLKLLKIDSSQSNDLFERKNYIAQKLVEEASKKSQILSLIIISLNKIKINEK